MNGTNLEVGVDETRPRNQGMATTRELHHNNIPNTLIVDNAGGHLMEDGLVDIVIVGSDRTTATGDVCNKIGTYLKALAAKDNDTPSMSPSQFDNRHVLDDGIAEIPIEEREQSEVTPSWPHRRRRHDSVKYVPTACRRQPGL